MIKAANLQVFGLPILRRFRRPTGVRTWPSRRTQRVKGFQGFDRDRHH